MDKHLYLQGWECPKCGAVMSPSASVCVNCNGHIEVTLNCNSIMPDKYIGLSPELKREVMKAEGKNIMDKQIDEMARILTLCSRNTCVGCGMECIDYRMVKAIYNAGYRKIPENAVALTGTETEEYLEDLLTEFDEMSFYPATLMPNAEECAREWKRKLIYAIGQLRKEMAEKFAEMVKEATDHGISALYDSTVDEICKEFTEGKANASKTEL